MMHSDRLFSRNMCKIDANFKAGKGDEVLNATILNKGYDGLYMECDRSFPRGTKLMIMRKDLSSLSYGKGESDSWDCVVAWSADHGFPGRHRYGIGLQRVRDEKLPSISAKSDDNLWGWFKIR